MRTVAVSNRIRNLSTHREQKARMTVINTPENELGVLDYWANGNMEFPFGVYAHDGNR
jgi:hypothetical protein